MPLFAFRKWSCLTLLLAASATGHAADNEQVDSGWSVTGPTPSAVVHQMAPPNAPQSRILLDQVLRQTEGGLQLATTPRDEEVLRIAERAEASSSWRLIGIAPALPGDVSPQRKWSVAIGDPPRDANVPTSPPISGRASELGFRSPAMGNGPGLSPQTIDVSPVDAAATNQIRTESAPADDSTEDVLPGGVRLSRRRPVETPHASSTTIEPVRPCRRVNETSTPSASISLSNASPRPSSPT